MRFLADGPNIPDDLLEQRDRGNVVFFCGAGVSVPSGLPGFFQLTKQAMQKLGTPAEAKSRRLFERPRAPGEDPPFDQVFNLLHEEYRRSEVDDVVSRLLRTPGRASVETHQVILRLSRNARRLPQVVTTNFDWLFERADNSLQIHVAPALPDLAVVGSFDGIIYLHGRRTANASTRSSRRYLILSSSDFGRAYLADGWATRFVRDLLHSYVIVLVGYSASDPPVRYLLEGLHSRDGKKSAAIYAFDHGEAGADDLVRDRWRGLGVQAIPYTLRDKHGHAGLWSTLRAWAERADNPEAWRRSIVDMAQTNPKRLEAFQRGQVAALVRTSQGAALFAAATPPPPAEWLCVFDRFVRRATPTGTAGEESDPLSGYALDDDPPRMKDSSRGASDDFAEDLISLGPHDERTDRHKRIADGAAGGADPLPARLSQLAHWFTRVAGDPVAMWWAAGYETIQPRVLAGIQRDLRTSDTGPQGDKRRVWQLLIERFQHAPDERHDWYHLQPRLKQEGWTPGVLRDFERAVQPYLKAKRPSHYRFHPPQLDETMLTLQSVADFEVEFPGRDQEKLEIPSDMLPVVFEIARRALQRGSNLLLDIETQHWRTASFHAPEGPGRRYMNDASRYLHWVRALFDRLAAEHPEIARHELRSWPSDEPYFFNKFRIYAWTNSDVLPGQETAACLLSLSQSAFWHHEHRRELLHTLRSRWKDISDWEREQIETRILAGPSRWDAEEEDEYQERSADRIVRMLGWLELNGCALSDKTRSALIRLRETVPGWQSSWDVAADAGLDVTGGWLARNTDPSELLAAPVSDVIVLAGQRAAQRDRLLTTNEPFTGLVASHPRRALAALSIEARKRNFPAPFWRNLLAYWPGTTSDRLLKLCAGRLRNLPDDILLTCRYELIRWFTERAAQLFRISPQIALDFFDRLYRLLLAAGEEATQSAIGNTTFGGTQHARSRRTHDHAINSPAGQLADTLYSILDNLKLTPGAGIPVEIRNRIEQLWQLPGEGADHAVCETALQLNWLDNIDSEWTRTRVVPFLAPDHHFAEPAWNGLLSNSEMPPPQLFALVKPHFLKVFEYVSAWRWDRSDVAPVGLIERLVLACHWHQQDKRYVSYNEARIALRLCDDGGRAHAIRFLATSFEQESWPSFGKAFIKRAWPRESRFQTPTVSAQLAYLAEESGEHFPDVIRIVLPLLVAVDSLEVTIHRAADANGGESLAARFPEPMLQLLDHLVPDAPPYAPYQLNTTLEIIAAALPHLRDDIRWRRLNIIATEG